MQATIRFKGGVGSGHHGHQGRPGKHGGSLPGSGGLGEIEILTDNVARITKANGATIHIQGGTDAIKIFTESFDMLPDKAKTIVRESDESMRFFSSDNMRGSYQHVHSGHRLVIGKQLNAYDYMEEWGHLLDFELGGKGRTEYSRKRVWQDLIKQEDARPKYYDRGLATEDFAKTFARYVTEPTKLQSLYPLHYAAHDELFGGDS